MLPSPPPSGGPQASVAQPTASPQSANVIGQPVGTGAGTVIPQPKAPTRTWWGWSQERDERKQIERDEAQSHNIRRIAAYGAILMVVLMYAAGLFAIAFFLGLTCFEEDMVAADRWHIVVAVLVALFTVPTVLAISVMRLAGARAEEVPATVHEWLAKLAEKLADKIAQ